MSTQIPTVWLAAYPRSGVTFLRLVIESLYDVPTYTDKANEWLATGALFPAGRLYPQECNGKPGAFVKTHNIDHAWGPMPAIHLVRDPRDVLVSYAHFLKDMSGVYGEHWEVLTRCVRGLCPYGTWAQHTVTWLGRPAPRIHFEDLVANPVETVTKAVDALGLDFKPKSDSVPEFKKLQETHPKFFRSGQSGQWKEEFPPHLLTVFEGLYGAALRAYVDAFGRESIRGERAEKREVA